MESAASNIVFGYFVLPYTRNVWWGKFGKFTLYKHFAKKFGELIDQAKGY